MKLQELSKKLKNKYVIRVIAGVLVVGLLGTGMSYTARASKDGENKPNTTTEATDNNETKKDSLAGLLNDVTVEQKEIGKSETVYFLCDSTGAAYNTIVSDHLLNNEKAETIKDKSCLTDIENVKGDEDYSKDGETLVWNAKGEDIYYQGTTNKEAPVSQKVTYYLDGSEISPEELAGKSGKVTIRFDYTNNTSFTETVNGEKVTVVVPFAAVTTLMLDDHFTNVETSNGRIENMAKGTLVMGYALPGVIDCLEAEEGFFSEDLDVPESFTVTADVTDFELTTAMTAVVNAGSLTDINSDIDMTEIDEMIHTLSDASLQLTDGSAQLAEGLDTLKSSLVEFQDGMKSLNTGIGTYTDGVYQVATGIEKLNDSIPALTDGLSKLDTGITAIYENMAKLETGAAQLATGADQLKDGIAAGLVSASQLKASERQVGGVFTAMKNYGVTAENYEAGVKMVVKAQAEPQVRAAVFAKVGIDESVYGQLASAEASKTALDAAIAQTAENYGIPEETAKAMVLQNQGITAEQYEALASAVAKKGQIDAAIAENTEAVVNEKSQALMSDSLKAIYAAYLADTDAIDGASFIGGFVAGTSNALTSVQAGAEALASGAHTLSDGISALNSQAVVPVYNGMQLLNQNIPTLTAGVTALKDGSAQLAANNESLVNGSKKLLDGTNAIVDGVDQLESGSNELSDGMVKFNEEGISRIVNAYTGDIKPLSSKLQAMIDASNSYESFTGLSDGVSGNVKFIYKLDAITEE